MNAPLEGRSTPDDEDGDDPATREVIETLYAVQHAILRHPMVIQAAFSALVAEGRRFAATGEGAALHDRLRRGASADRARMIWEMLTTNGFVERPTHVLPTVFLERLVRSLAVEPLEPLLSRLFQPRGP
jgi:hypothetical protein